GRRWNGRSVGMGMITADQGAAMGARRLQRREMIFGMNFKTVIAVRDIARGMECHRGRDILPPLSLDQPAALGRESGTCFRFDPPPQRLRQDELHFSAWAFTCPTR